MTEEQALAVYLKSLRQHIQEPGRPKNPCLRCDWRNVRCPAGLCMSCCTEVCG